MKVVKLCKTHKKASLSSCLLWLRRELALSPKQHSTINHDLPKIFYSGSKVNMKTHRSYWRVRSVAQPSGVLAAGATITWGPILNHLTGSKLHPCGSCVPWGLTEGTLRTPGNAQRQLRELAVQPAALRHQLWSWIPPGGGDSREPPAENGEHWQEKPWPGSAGARSGPWGCSENFPAKLQHSFNECVGSEIFQRISIQQNWGGVCVWFFFFK